MATPEVIEIVEALESSLGEFTAALDGIPEAKAQTRPAEGRWSALECAEHLALVEERFLERLQSAPATLATTSIDRGKESTVSTGMADRSRKANAPEAVQPSGRFATLAEAMEALRAARARTIDFAREKGPGLCALDLNHIRFGALNGAEFLKLSSFHTRRHSEQAREVRAAVL